MAGLPAGEPSSVPCRRPCWKVPVEGFPATERLRSPFARPAETRTAGHTAGSHRPSGHPGCHWDLRRKPVIAGPEVLPSGAVALRRLLASEPRGEHCSVCAAELQEPVGRPQFGVAGGKPAGVGLAGTG